MYNKLSDKQKQMHIQYVCQLTRNVYSENRNIKLLLPIYCIYAGAHTPTDGRIRWDLHRWGKYNTGSYETLQSGNNKETLSHKMY